MNGRWSKPRPLIVMAAAFVVVVVGALVGAFVYEPAAIVAVPALIVFGWYGFVAAGVGGD